MMAILQFTFLTKSMARQLEIANMAMKMASRNADTEFDYSKVKFTDRLFTMCNSCPTF